MQAEIPVPPVHREKCRNIWPPRLSASWSGLARSWPITKRGAWRVAPHCATCGRRRASGRPRMCERHSLRRVLSALGVSRERPHNVCYETSERLSRRRRLRRERRAAVAARLIASAVTGQTGGQPLSSRPALTPRRIPTCHPSRRVIQTIPGATSCEVSGDNRPNRA